LDFYDCGDVLTRRQALHRFGLAAFGTLAAPLLTAGRDASVVLAGAPPTPGGTPVRGGTLALSLDGIPGANISPATSGVAEIVLGMHVYEGLVAPDPVTGAGVRPVLAESWQVSPDGRVYTFRLRRGVTFHDSTPFTAEAVELNFRRLRDPNSRFFFKIGEAVSNIVFRLTDRVEVADDYTVRYHMRERDPDFIYLLRRPQALFMSPTVIKQFTPDEAGKHPVGTGPFRLTEQQEGTRYTLERFSGYWDGAPYLERLVYRPGLDPTASVAALLAGELDLLTEASYDTIDRLKGRFVPFEWGPEFHWTVTLNTRHPFTRDVRVRQALNYALNREAWVQGIFKGFAKPARGPATTGYPAWNPGLRGYPYDPDRAKALLAAAGYESGVRVKAMIPTTGVPLAQEIGQSIQADLRKVGIDLRYDALEFNAYFSRFRQGLTEEHIFGVSWWASDFLAFLEQQLSQSRWPPNGVNRGWYHNAEADRLLTAGREESNDEKRKAIYQRAERIIVNDAPWLFTVYFRRIGLKSQKVQSIRSYASQTPDYSKTWLKR